MNHEYRDLEAPLFTLELAIIERIPATTKSGSFEIDSDLLDLAGGDIGMVMGEVYKRILKLRASMSITYEAAPGWIRNNPLVEWSR